MSVLWPEVESPRPSFACSVFRIVSGGQTGADRAALDWAIGHGLPHGGWCPKGRLAEDGAIDRRYALQETRTTDYLDRTRQNVIDSDATLILNLGELNGGSRATQRFAEDLGKPCLLVQLDAAAQADEAEVDRVRAWLAAGRVAVLNVAGPRESKRPGIYHQTLAFLDRLHA